MMEMVAPRPLLTIRLRQTLLLFTVRLVNGELYQLVQVVSR